MSEGGWYVRKTRQRRINEKQLLYADLNTSCARTQHTISFQRGAVTGLWENRRRLAYCMTAINFTLSRVKCFFHAPYLLQYS